MKIATLLLASLVFASQMPVSAKDEKEKKPSKSEERDMAKKDEDKAKKNKAKADKEKNKDRFTATVSTTAAPTDADAAELKSLLNTGTEFMCDKVEVANGKLAAAISVHTGGDRLNKSSVSKLMKSNTKFKLDSLAEQKPEAEEKKDAKK